MPKYYVTAARFQGTYDLRQERFRAQRDAGREHPHDLMAAGFTADSMRALIAQTFPDTDGSALPRQECPSCPHGLGFKCPHCWG